MLRIEKGRLRLPPYTEHLAALEGWVVGGSFRLGSDGADDPHPLPAADLEAPIFELLFAACSLRLLVKCDRSSHQAPAVGIEDFQYGRFWGDCRPMHQIAEAFLLPGIGATLVKRQVGAAGQKARGIEKPIGLLSRLVPPARPGLAHRQLLAAAEQLGVKIQAGQCRPPEIQHLQITASGEHGNAALLQFLAAEELHGRRQVAGHHLMAKSFGKGRLQIARHIEHAKGSIRSIPTALPMPSPMKCTGVMAAMDPNPLATGSNSQQTQPLGLLRRRQRQAHVSEPIGSQTAVP